MMLNSQAMDLDQTLFPFMYRHIIFPLQLPQTAEESFFQLENQMVAVVRDTLQEFTRDLTPELQQRWDIALKMLNS